MQSDHRALKQISMECVTCVTQIISHASENITPSTFVATSPTDQVPKIVLITQDLALAFRSLFAQSKVCWKAIILERR
jgi:hypothetical protein